MKGKSETGYIPFCRAIWAVGSVPQFWIAGHAVTLNGIAIPIRDRAKSALSLNSASFANNRMELAMDRTAIVTGGTCGLGRVISVTLKRGLY